MTKIKPKEERVYRYLAKQTKKKKGSWDFDDYPDPRRQSESLDHKISSVLWSLTFGLFANVPTLRGTEEMKKGPIVRQLVPDRISDTTLDTEARRLDEETLTQKLVLQIRDYQRSKMLKPSILPFGVATVDGKNLATLNHDADGTGHARSSENSKWHKDESDDNGKPYWLMPALRSTLTSTEMKPVIYQDRLPPGVGESSMFKEHVDNLHKVYGKSNMFEVIDGDAGLTSLANADHVDSKGYAYVFGLKGNQPELYAEAQRLLLQMAKLLEPESQTSWERRNGNLIRRSLWRTNEMKGIENSVGRWDHLRQAWLVRQETKHPDGKIEVEDRFFISSLLWNRLNGTQILALVRGHWGVEISFNSLDLQWKEDGGRWCTQGHAVWGLGLLRLMAYNVAQYFRTRCLRRKDKKGNWLKPLPWRDTFDAVKAALEGKVYESVPEMTI